MIVGRLSIKFKKENINVRIKSKHLPREPIIQIRAISDMS